jgi:hypothetical protein
MVGPPKSLSDLRRVEAQINVICRGCKTEQVWELDALIEEVERNGGNTNWFTARYAVKCPRNCPAPLIDLQIIPFGERRARRRAHRHALLNLALQILHEATALSVTEPVGTIYVRLALHVLRPMVEDHQLLTDFWDAATAKRRGPWRNCRGQYRRIVERLIERGAPIDAKHLP